MPSSHSPVKLATRHRIARCALLGAISAVPIAGLGADAVPLKQARMIIEYNASAADIGIQFFLDSDGWTEVDIRDPAGRLIFRSSTKNNITQQGGGTELFLESVEPAVEELPLEEFFARFPEGSYRFRARHGEEALQLGNTVFSHAIPAGPVLITPVPEGGADCAVAVELPLVIAWDPVTHSIFDEPLEIVRYEVIVENADLHFDVNFPAATGTGLTVSPELLQPDTEYAFEVLAIEAGGNQTITEGCFTTAP